MSCFVTKKIIIIKNNELFLLPPVMELNEQCSSMNMSYCPVTEETISGQKSLVIP